MPRQCFCLRRYKLLPSNLTNGNCLVYLARQTKFYFQNFIYLSILFFLISAVSGDIRKALDVCQRALILAEIEDRNQTRLKLFDQKSEEKPAVALIGIPQILKVVNEIYCSSVTTAMRNGNFS